MAVPPAFDPFDPGLYIVATPIGNLGDIAPRAVAVLAAADLIACEDSRVTGKLLHHLGLKKRMRPYHDHSDEGVRQGLIAAARGGVVALVSDAGTPLVSDPGYKLARDARAAGVMVTGVPGPSAPIAALTLSGLPSDRFLFAGFLPAKAAARTKEIAGLAGVRATLILFESGPRLAACLAALAQGLGAREAAVVREISKKFEEVATGSLAELATRYADAPPKGEIVLVVGPPPEAAADPQAVEDALRAALARLPASQAAAEVARAHGADRRALYALAQRWKADGA